MEDPEANKESGLTHEDHKLLSGALEYSSKHVRDVMTPLDRVYMIEASTRLGFDNMLDIYKSGYTRIPVYEGSRQKIIGILYVKDLILVDPDDEIEVRWMPRMGTKPAVLPLLAIEIGGHCASVG